MSPQIALSACMSVYNDGFLRPRDFYWPPQIYETLSLPVGWICPVCGAGNSPRVTQCPCTQRETSTKRHNDIENEERE